MKRVGTAFGVLLACAGATQAAEALQPYQMVRSLQLVQDRIAAGDHAALPMQKKLLEMIDQRFRQAQAADFEDRRNFRAILVYGMSGGNPATLREVLSELKLDPPDEKIGNGILGYVSGQPKKAQVALSDANPLAFPPELGSFIALVKGSTIAIDNPKGAMPSLDQARLLAPGTLVEEAALRRSIDLSTTLQDPERFLHASDQYVRRYLRSPYASQFADAFVSGIVELNSSLKLADIEAITALMSPEQEKVIYLRIARRAVIDGLTELSTFASAKAEGATPQPGTEDPRALLYASLATVTSGDIPDVLTKLDRIDRSKLSSSDRELLDAVRAVAAEVISPVRTDTKVSAAPANPGEAIPVEAGAPDQQQRDTGPREPSSHPAVESPAGDAHGEAPPSDHAAPEPTPIDSAPLEAGAQPTDTETPPEEKFVSDARQKLDAIDQLLSEKQ